MKNCMNCKMTEGWNIMIYSDEQEDPEETAEKELEMLLYLYLWEDILRPEAQLQLDLGLELLLDLQTYYSQADFGTEL